MNISELTPSVKLEPLMDDLSKIVSFKFLSSASFKRWLIKQQIDDYWNCTIESVKKAYSQSGVIFIGFPEMDEALWDTFVYVCNNYYDNGEKALLPFIFDLLSLYKEQVGEIKNLADIKQDFEVLGVYSKKEIEIMDSLMNKEIELDGANEVRKYEKEYLNTVNAKDANSREAIEAYRKWHEEAVKYLSKFCDKDPDFEKLKDLDNSCNGYGLKRNFDGIRTVYNLLMEKTMKKMDEVLTHEKKPMLFISHASDDKPFVKALVELFEAIGFNKKNMFCSSVSGYGIKVNEDIFETLRLLFDRYDIYAVFVLSPNFYKRPVCLNEMGAAWVLKTNFSCILTCDMDYADIDGVVPKNNIYIKGVLDRDNQGRLNEFKSELVDFFNLENVVEGITWEEKRDDFLKKVSTIRSESKVDCASKNTLKNANDSAALNKNIDLLSDEEKTVLCLIKGGWDIYEIASQLGYTVDAVRGIINSLIVKELVVSSKEGMSIKFIAVEKK